MPFVLAQLSDNYIDLLDDLVVEATKKSVASAAVVSGGTGYTVNDVLTVSGGTGVAAELTVTAETGGVIDSVSVTNQGRYTVPPSNPVSVTGGTGGDDATFDLTLFGWDLMLETQEAVSATVADGGTGYSVNDQLTLVGGTLSQLTGSAAAVFNVDTVSGGAVTAVSLVSKGKYDFVPSDPVSTTVSPSGGTGAELNVTWQGFEGGEKQVILRGSGNSGTDEIYIGIAALDFGSGVTQWDIRGFTGFQQNVVFYEQPGISPVGSYVPLNNASIRHWFFIDGRRIIGIFRMGGTYTNMYLGFINQFGTALQYPYPLLVMGCSSSPQLFSSSTIAISGMVDPINITTGGTNGPGYIRTPDGTWRGIANSSGTSLRLSNHGLVVWPAGRSQSSNANFNMTDFIPGTGNPGTPESIMKQTPNSARTSGFEFPIISTIITQTTPTEQLLGEMSGVYWVGTLTEDIGQAISEDQYDDNGQIYHLFQNGNRTDHWAYFLIKEE